MIVDTSKGKDIFGSGWNARSRVEEYGGGAAIAYGGVVYFSNFGDLKVYAVDVEKGGEPVVVTPGIFCALLSVSFVADDPWRETRGSTQKTKITDLQISPSHPTTLISLSRS